MFKGSRVESGEYFDDVLTKDAGGVFESQGLDDYEGVKEQVSGDGVQVRMNCRVCNKQHDVTLEWQELFIAGSNKPGLMPILPKDWEYSQNNGTMYPAKIPCSKCANPLCPQITPDEARDRVNQGISQGLVSPQQAQQWAQQVAMYRQQRGG